jgi:hypothetical protein
MPQAEAHEAGHAVIGRVVGVPIGWVVAQVAFDDTHRRAQGIEAYTQICPPERLLRRWSYTMPHRSRATAIHALILTLMAGHIAEDLIEDYADFKEALFGTTKDMQDTIDLLFELGLKDKDEERSRMFRRLYRHAQVLVRRHETTIRRVTSYLLIHSVINGEEIDQLRGGWMPHVKPFVKKRRTIR